jgi:hypothetical protein
MKKKICGEIERGKKELVQRAAGGAEADEKHGERH